MIELLEAIVLWIVFLLGIGIAAIADIVVAALVVADRIDRDGGMREEDLP